MSDSFALKYTALKFFHYSIVVSLIAFVFWQILTPAQDLYDNFSLGLILFFLLSLFTFLAWKTQAHSILGSIFFWPASLFWLILFIFMINAYPSVEDITYQNRTVYILTFNKDMLQPQYYGFQVTRWAWDALPETSWLSERNGDMQFVYDEEKKTTLVVSTYPKGNRLLYMDDGVSRRTVEGYTETEFKNHIYFVSMNCDWKKDSLTCDPYTYLIAECDLDLTTCENLPFQYQDRYADPYLEVDEENNELNFILEFADPPYGLGEWTLSDVKIYTYGAYPRCYVEGCAIPNIP